VRGGVHCWLFPPGAGIPSAGSSACGPDNRGHGLYLQKASRFDCLDFSLGMQNVSVTVMQHVTATLHGTHLYEVCVMHFHGSRLWFLLLKRHQAVQLLIGKGLTGRPVTPPYCVCKLSPCFDDDMADFSNGIG
jgi:hypothetical protein